MGVISELEGVVGKDNRGGTSRQGQHDEATGDKEGFHELMGFPFCYEIAGFYVKL
jgi:hypothetical protein